MKRDEYLVRAREFQPRGEELNHARLTADEVAAIRSAAVQRERLREYIRRELSNDALAAKFGVHRRTVEKVTAFESWCHVLGPATKDTGDLFAA